MNTNNEVALVIDWNSKQISKQLGINKISGFQKFDGMHVMHINDKVPVIRIMGDDFALQVMQWVSNKPKWLATNGTRCLILAHKIKFGNKHLCSKKSFFLITGVYSKMQMKYNVVKYVVAMHVENPLRYLYLNTSWMPAIISEKRAKMYMNHTLSLNETITAENFKSEIYTQSCMVSDKDNTAKEISDSNEVEMKNSDEIDNETISNNTSEIKHSAGNNIEELKENDNINDADEIINKD